MKVKSLLMTTFPVVLLLLALRLASAQDFPKSLTLLHTNNINGEIDPCPV